MNDHPLKIKIPILLHHLRTWLMLALLAAAPAGAADAGLAATNALASAATNHLSSADAPASPGGEQEPLILRVMGISIGLAGTVLGIGLAMLAIWTEYKKRQELISACHRERMAALEKGIEPPPFPAGLWQSDDGPRRPPGSGLKTGLVLLGVGAGLWLFLPPDGRGLFQSSVGAIPGAIGVAYLVYYGIEGRRRQAAAMLEASPAPPGR